LLEAPKENKNKKNRGKHYCLRHWTCRVGSWGVLPRRPHNVSSWKPSRDSNWIHYMQWSYTTLTQLN